MALLVPPPLLLLLPLGGVLLYTALQHAWLSYRARHDSFHGGVSALCGTAFLFVGGRVIQLLGADQVHARVGIELQYLGAFALAAYLVLTFEGARGRRLPVALTLIPATGALLLFTSDAFVTGAVLPRIGLFGNHYHAVGSGPLSFAIIPAAIAGSIAWFRFAQRRESQRVWSLRVWGWVAIAGGVAVLHDVAMNAALIRSVHLIEYALAGVALGLSQVTMRRAREQIVNLESAVRRRTWELRDSEGRFRQLAEVTTEGVILQREGKVENANDAALRMLRAPLDAVRGSDFISHLAPEERERAKSALADGAKEPIECRLASGLTVELRTRAHDGDVVLLLRDLTERKALQSKLLVADRMASLGTLAAGVAHEINNPLTYVFTNVQVATELARQGASGEQIVECLRDAAAGCQRVQGIVEDLRKLSRDSETERVPVDVVSIVEGCVHIANNEIRHRARVDLRLSPVPPVLANDGRLAQVLLNLIINAAQAMPSGQADRMTLTIATFRDTAGRVVIEVRDTGCGIPPEVRERVFDPFFTTKGPGQGTGLGLSICHSIVSGLGGNIEVESTVGVGSTFRVRLPATSEKPVSSPGFEIAPPSVAEAAVLVIDDEPSVRRAIARALRGNTLILTASADEALELCSAARFDVIFCDVMMPGKSGIDFFQELSERDPVLASRVVFITGGAYTDAARTFLASVPNPTVPKPFDVSVLRETLQRVVSREQPAMLH